MPSRSTNSAHLHLVPRRTLAQKLALMVAAEKMYEALLATLAIIDYDRYPGTALIVENAIEEATNSK